MISAIKDKVSSFFSLFQERPVYTVALAMGMSALLAGISLYLFVFAGRSLLPAPLAGDAPATPHMTSVPVQIASLGQPAAQPPVSPPQEGPVFEQQIAAAAPSEGTAAVASAMSESATAVASAVKSPDDEKSKSEHDENKLAVVSNAEHKSERHWYSQKEKEKKED